MHAFQDSQKNKSILPFFFFFNNFIHGVCFKTFSQTRYQTQLKKKKKQLTPDVVSK